MSMFTSFWEKHGEKIQSIAKGAAIAGTGAFITYSLESLSGFDFGEYTGIAVAVAGVFVNAVRKFGVPVISIVFKGSVL